MNLPLRVEAVRESLRGSLWFLPSVAVATALVAGVVLARVEVPEAVFYAPLLFGGGPEGARGVLEVIAGSIVTVTSLTFSLTVVALQMAAGQYSPRVLRNFLRDRGNQVVLATFLGTFAFSIVVLRTIRSGDEQGASFVPQLAVTVALLLMLASLSALVYFIHHLTQSIRVEEIMRKVEGDTLDCIERNAADGDGDGGEFEPDDLPEPPPHALELQVQGSGRLQAVKPRVLMRLATERDLVIRVRPTVGESLTEGTVLAWIWSPNDDQRPDEDGALRDGFREGLRVGNERTLQQDVAFGVRQLVDIAVRSMSPGINDPATAVTAIGHVSAVLAGLQARSLGDRLHRDGDGRARVAVPWPDYDDFVALACAQIAHYGAGDVPVVRRLLQLLAETGRGAVTEGRRRAVLREIDRVVDEAEAALELQWARTAVAEAAAAARAAARGAAVPVARPIL